LREVTERIRQKLEVDKSEFKTWNFYKINASKPGREKKKGPITEHEIVTLSDYSNRPGKGPYYFGLEHKKPIKRETKHDALGVKFYNTQADDDQ